ncbi:MAG: choice-of-anchor L domain-containing protein, partial [Bacteroidota bacterium]
MQSGKLRRILLLLFFSMLIVHAESQIVVNTAVTPDQMVQSLIGTGVTYSNVTFKGNTNSRGTFLGPNNIGISTGVVLCTGSASTISGAPGGSVGGPSGSAFMDDPDLNAICNISATQHSYNGSILEFDFVPQGDLITFHYVFASEEYPNYAPPCSSGYNDGFGFLISGPGLSGPYLGNTGPNVALLPESNTPVSINNVNAITNAAYYVSNYNGNGQCTAPGWVSGTIHDANFKFDGYTVVLEAKITVVPCANYHIKLGVANAVDQAEQSGVFLEENSFSSNAIAVNPVYTIATYDTMVEGCNNVSLVFGAGQTSVADISIPLTFGGTAINGIDFPLLPSTVIIPAGSLTTTLPIIPYADGIAEPIETFTVTYSNVSCSGPSTSTSTYYIKDYPPLQATASNDVSVYCNQPVTISSAHTGGITPYQFLWSTGGTTASVSVSPTTTTTYTVQVTDGCGSISTD